VERKEISNEIKIFNGIPKKISKANLSQLLSEHVGRSLLEILKEIKGGRNIISPEGEKESVLAHIRVHYTRANGETNLIAHLVAFCSSSM
jgi:hypothetical protein